MHVGTGVRPVTRCPGFYPRSRAGSDCSRFLAAIGQCLDAYEVSIHAPARGATCRTLLTVLSYG